MGRLSATHTKGRLVFSFAYQKDWLLAGHAQSLDPDLKYFEGPQYLGEGKKNFGIFINSSADRWGRMLMKRREAIRARMEVTKERTLFEEDYLLCVFDLHRMGAIRYKMDAIDIGGWEKVTEILAKKGGLNIAEGYTRKFNSHHHCYLSKRFDRLAGDRRSQFASAMMLLGHNDGEEGTSYIELADFIIQHGANTGKDLEELWRRIVFNIAVKNTDDHLRNHGFLLAQSGWILSPAYDINPVSHGTGLTLNISETDNPSILGWHFR